MGIRVLTRPSDWTDSQRLMMDRASRFYASRGLVLAILIVLAGWGVVAGYGNLRASALVNSLRSARTADVPLIIKELSKYRPWADPKLRQLVHESDEQGRERLHAGLALLEVDDSQVEFLFRRMLTALPRSCPSYATPWKHTSPAWSQGSGRCWNRPSRGMNGFCAWPAA